MSTRPGRLNGLRHLALLVPNLEECERFYVDVLGMKVLHRANADLVYLTCGNDNLSLGRAHVPSGGGQAVDHYGFVVDSVEELDAWYAYCKSLNVTVLDRPFDHGDGARSFHLLDPAGNKIQPLFHPAVSGQRFSSPKP
ncbi:VOC family protein [Pseudomonas borbori]